MVASSARAVLLVLAVGGALSAPTIGDGQRTVVVTGATGRTGALVYKRLKAASLWNVRAFVRNATKAKDILGCSACDEAEGVFTGDITQPSSIKAVMQGADALVITSASQPICSGFLPFKQCSYAKGAEPKVIDWEGTRAQVKAFALSAAASGGIETKQVLYVSSMGTESPNTFLDKIGNGQTLFYHLNAEAFIMSSGVPFTVVKPCGLTDGPGEKHKLIVGHNGEDFSLIIDHSIQRDDVARVLVEAVRNPAASKNLRFDLCSHFLGSPTTDVVKDIFEAARLPWSRKGGRGGRGGAATAIQDVVV